MTKSLATLRDDPVIVLGMHHSGTSILAEILHRSGVFMQANMRHHESKFFVEINDELVMGGDANWARLPIMSVNEVMSKLEAVRHRVEKKGFQKYLEAGYDGRSRWGFKDPRACVTLPLYLEIFPNAQLLHIARNENDVAVSLSNNEKKGLGRNVDLEFWKELQRQYVARAREFGQRHKSYYEFRYEDFCLRPVEVMQNVFEFLGLPFTAATGAFLKDHVYTHRVNLIAQPEAETKKEFLQRID